MEARIYTSARSFLDKTLLQAEKNKPNTASNKVYWSTSGSTQGYTFVHSYKGLTSLYLIILAVEFADSRMTRGVLHTLASIQDIAGITHTAF